MKFHRYSDAIVIETHGGPVRRLADAYTAQRMARTYTREAVRWAVERGGARSFAEFRAAVDTDPQMRYLIWMAQAWNDFAVQLLISWLTFGLLGKDRLVFTERKQA